MAESFLERFMYVQGKQECPPEFFQWVGISAMAACLGDRVWFEKFRGSRLLPNLYVILIGPSGLGKGVAIDAALRVLKEDEEKVRLYRGKVTGPGIIDHLSNAHKRQEVCKASGLPYDETDVHRLFLVTPELSMSVGSGPMADMFVKLLTELYTGGDYTFQEGTRTSGAKKLQSPVVNWLAGSTEDWLVNSITKDAICGGFFARVCAVMAKYDFGARFLEPEYPPDYADVVLWLRERVRWMQRVSGQAYLTKQAHEVMRQWYMTRDVPDDELLLPTWKREHDMVLKMAMLYMIDEAPESLKIQSKHVIEAQKQVRRVLKHVPYLVTLASITPERDSIVFISRLIRNSGTVDLEMLYHQAARRGLTKYRTGDVLETLAAAGDVEIDTTNIPSVRWKRRA